MIIEDLLSENLVDFSNQEKKNNQEIEKPVEYDKSKLTRLQIVTINGDIVDV